MRPPPDFRLPEQDGLRQFFCRTMQEFARLDRLIDERGDTMAELLIIEPDAQQSQLMSYALERAGHRCTVCNAIPEASRVLQGARRTMTLLNAQLPWSESGTFLHALERRGLPVLFITPDSGTIGHLKAMYQSRCDVLLAPYSAASLTRAVSQLLDPTRQTLEIGGLCLNLDDRTVTQDGRNLSLTAQEFALLHALMASRGAAVTREELLRTAWGYQGMGMTRTVDVHVQRLRRKLGSGCIETIYKTGYRLRMA